MRLWIDHKVRYPLEEPAHHSILVVRQTPRPDPSQMVTTWTVTTSGSMQAWTDGFGNLAHVSVQQGLHREVLIAAEGEVDTYDTHGVLPPDDGLPPLMFLRETAPTRVSEAISALAVPFAERRDDEGAIAALHALMWALHAAVAHAPDMAEAVTAAEALERGHGRGRDHAHLMIVCCRVLGIPARFVSGYRIGDQDEPPLSAHAWAEAYVDDLGWVAFDSAHAICPTDAYIRLAVAMDYTGASPVRGVGPELAGETISASLRRPDAGEAQSQSQSQSQGDGGKQAERQ